MARAAHSWYLRNTYVENNLVEPGKIQLKGEALDLGRITAGHLRGRGGEGPHCAVGRGLTDLPAHRRRRSFRACVQRPHRWHYQPAWRQRGLLDERRPGRHAQAVARGRGAPRRELVADWAAWLAARSGEMVAPPTMGSEAYPPLEDAPGNYVLEK